MVTIVRQSSSNVGRLKARGGQEEVWSYSSSISAKDFDRGGSEATGQEGRKQVCMCVNERERVGGETSQEVVVMSFNSMADGLWSFTRECEGDGGESRMGKTDGRTEESYQGIKQLCR